MLKNSNKAGSLQIGRRISIISTTVLIMLMLVYLIITIEGSVKLSDQTEIISEHPFEVVISAGDIKLYVSEMSIRAGRLLRHHSNEDIQFVSEELKDLYSSLETPISHINKLYLGDRQDIESLQDTLSRLNIEQDNYLKYVSRPDISETQVESYEQEYLEPLYTEALEKTEHIITTAQEKKIGYGETSAYLRKTMLIGSFAIIIVMITTLLVSQFVLHKQRKELLYRNQLFDGLSQSIDDAFLIQDGKTGEVRYSSLNMERMFGSISSPDAIYQGMKPDDAEIFKVTLAKANFHNTVEKMVEYTRTDGKKLWMLVRMYKIEKAHPAHFITVFSDRTEEILSQEVLQDAMLSAQQANIAKSEFLSRMSHEIRTPLNAIVGMISISESNITNPVQVKDCLEKADISAKHLLMIINDVLDMSKIDSNKMVLENETFDIFELINSFAASISTQSKAKNIEFNESIEGFNECTVFTGDALRLNQILLNLGSNAVKFTPSGGKITLTVSRIASKNRVDILRFILSDTGIGMTQEAIDKIFQPFEQADSSIARRYGGTGLGMSITKNLVTLMNGTIRVESEPDKGSSFIVDIPFQRGKEKDESSFPSLSSDTQTTLEGKTLLVAEDHPINQEVVQMLLEDKGAQVQCASNGQEALDAFLASDPGTFDAILMDVQMPVMDGHEASRLIRASAHPDASCIPIIAVTANAFSDDISAALSAGMNAHVSKPLDMVQLCRVLEECSVKNNFI